METLLAGSAKTMSSPLEVSSSSQGTAAAPAADTSVETDISSMNEMYTQMVEVAQDELSKELENLLTPEDREAAERGATSSGGAPVGPCGPRGVDPHRKDHITRHGLNFLRHRPTA